MPHFLHEALFVSVACTEALAIELVNVSGLQDLNEQKVDSKGCSVF